MRTNLDLDDSQDGLDPEKNPALKAIIESVGADFRRKIQKQSFLDKLMFWKYFFN